MKQSRELPMQGISTGNSSGHLSNAPLLSRWQPLARSQNHDVRLHRLSYVRLLVRIPIVAMLTAIVIHWIRNGTVTLKDLCGREALLPEAL